jgi:RNase H-like domain found in reverse transcriptase/Integrase zinc binding domain
MVIEEENIAMNAINMEGILKYELPQRIKEIKKFMGFCNYVRRFIPGYTEIMNLLQKKVNNKTKLEVTEDYLNLFERIKRNIYESSIWISNLSLEDDIFLFTDASDVGIGGTLGQGKEIDFSSPNGWTLPENVECKIVGLFSYQLKTSELNYSVIEKELYAIYKSLRHFEYLINSTRKKLVIVTDHKNLVEYHKFEIRRRRHLVWYEQLCLFNFEICHTSGTQNLVADVLSRMYSKQRQNEVVNKFFEETELSNRTTIIQDANFFEVKNIQDSKEHIHPGVTKTWELLRERGSVITRKLVADYIRRCHYCQIYKHSISQKAGCLMPILPPTSIGGFLNCDICRPLKTIGSQNKVFLLIIVDRLSCYVWSSIWQKLTTAENIISIISAIIVEHSFQTECILTDCGTQFSSSRWKGHWASRLIKALMTSAYFPEGDGISERVIQSLMT